MNRRSNFNNHVGNFGGLSFANNQFEFADPAFDEFHGLTMQRAEKWYGNKAAYEQTSDFINAQNVLDKDSGIKEAASSSFTNAIKPFVDSARYEEASFAVDDAVREFKNNKGFALATNNYAAFSAWSQKQRDELGWSDNDKSTFIKGIADQYEGVKVNEDGTVSGAFNGRDMGEYVDILKEVAPLLKDWDPTVVDQVLGEYQRGEWKDTIASDKKTTKYKDAAAIMKYVENYIDGNPKMQHFLETKRHINKYTDTVTLANQTIGALAESVTDQQTFDKIYAGLKKDTTVKGKEALADFETKYGVKGKDGKSIVDPKLYTFYNHMLASGAILGDQTKMSAAELFNSFGQVVGQYAQAKNSGAVDMATIQQKMAAGVELNATEKTILLGQHYHNALVNINEDVFISNKSYEAFLPHSGTEQTMSAFRTFKDDGKAWMAQHAFELEEKRLSLLTTETAQRTPDVFADIADKGLVAFDKKASEFKVNAGLAAKEVVGYIDEFNKAIARYNAKLPDGQPKVGTIARPSIVTSADYANIASLKPEQIALLQRIAPSNFNAYVQKADAMMSADAQFKRTNQLLDDAIEYASNNGGEKLKSDEQLEQEYLAIKKANPVGTSTGPTYERDVSLEQFKRDYRHKFIDNNKIATQYVKDRISSGIYGNEISFVGVRKGGGGNEQEKALSRVLEATDSYIFNRIVGKMGYTATLNDGQVITSPDGIELVDAKGSNPRVKSVRTVGISQNPITGVTTYKLAMSTTEGKDLANSEPDGFIEIVDTNSQLDENIDMLLQKGGQYLDNEAANTLRNMMITKNYEGKVNYNNVRSDLANLGAGVLTFKDTGTGATQQFGTVRTEYARHNNPVDGNITGQQTDKSNMTLVLDYKVGDENRTANFKNMTDLAAFVNTQYHVAFPAKY